MDGLNSLSVLDNNIQSLAQKVYTGKELDRVCAFYNEHCEAVEKELKALQIIKENIEIYENKDGYHLTYKNPAIPVNCCKLLTREQYKILKEAGIRHERIY